MDLLTTVPVAALVALPTSLVGVWFADWMGFRRDRERLRLELDWKAKEKRLEALLRLLEKAPLLSARPENVVNSVNHLCNWMEHEAEPWLSDAQSKEIEAIREPVSSWLKQVQSDTIRGTDTLKGEVPSKEINALRNEIINSIKQAIRDITSENEAVTKSSAW
ncbi:MAG: hypothetical protein AAFQ32_13445 [Pseudomonadota bacterium]